ncbi:hypothetical protein HNV11_03320 [Spirosoma taeanense]|uniref:Outer membrane protein beta-barrel domain-containing protein n=1 Tax=Spirosoma taeanense TaxID=2735870 RepID=A0A6M5Y3T9_9BACT|nr:hypothetical protein [Spirosoma taeanense]QJW88469.1 hypothetical protein HNV11_03320 [Spirosoma taeanense]
MRTVYTIKGIALLGWLLINGGARAQNTDPEDETYQTITTYGITTNTNSGIVGGLSFRQARLLPGEFFGLPQYRYLSVELVNVKHPKEIQTTNNFASSRFIQGKENYLFALRGQYGRELKLFQRSADEGISVSGIVAAGPTLGIVKPYYVQIQEGTRTLTVPYSSLNRAGQAGAPIGSGGFFQGLGESKLTVGLNVKTAISFELSTFRNNTTGVEIGFLAEVFPNKIIIIPNTNPNGNRAEGNRSFFTSGYITLFFGNKK